MKYLKLFEEYDYSAYDNDAGDKFWGSKGAGCLIFAKSTGKFLIAFRSRFVNEGESWGIFGGKVDRFEDSLMQAAKREFEEETGYSGNIDLIELYKFRTESGSFEYQNYLGIIDKEFDPVLDWENEDWKWLTLDELMNIEPKHFGLTALLSDNESFDTLRELASEGLNENKSYKNKFKKLENILLKIGGDKVIYQLDEDLDDLIEKGFEILKDFDPEIITLQMEQSKCHKNVSIFYKNFIEENSPDEIDIMTGWVLTDNVWYQHSWVYLTFDNKIIESTFKREKYFGIILNYNKIDDFLDNN